MTQEELWTRRYDEILRYISQHHCRPSKYNIEDRDMHNWLKYNKKIMNKGKLPANRTERFQQLLDLLATHHHVNQYK